MTARTLSPSERVDQAHETHVHAHDGDFAHEVIGGVARDPRMSGGAVRAEIFDERVDLQLREISGEMRSLRMTVMSRGSEERSAGTRPR